MSDRDPARHVAIRNGLKAAGSSLSDLSRRLGVSNASVTTVSQGYRRSHRIQLAITRQLGQEAHELFPERYASDDRDRVRAFIEQRELGLISLLSDDDPIQAAAKAALQPEAEDAESWPGIGAARQAVYRDIARQLERAARTPGLSDPTIGLAALIERALVDAFRDGRDGTHVPLKAPLTPATPQAPVMPKVPPAQTEPTWLQLPARCCETLTIMTDPFRAKLLASDHPPPALPTRVALVQKDGKDRWQVVAPDGRYAPDDRMADGSERPPVQLSRPMANAAVRPLIEHGLLEQSPEHDERYALTQNGLRLCRDYWDWYRRDDPKMPVGSVRERGVPSVGLNPK